MATSPHQKAKALFDHLGLGISKRVYCPICAQIMKNPVRLNGIKESTFCAFCISQWLQQKKLNPMTKEPLTDVILIPDKELNVEIRNLYDTAKQACDWLVVSSIKHNDGSKEANEAVQWFKANLIHLQSSYEWTPWMRETAINGLQAFVKQFCAPAAEIYDAESVKKIRNDDGANWKHEIEEIRKSGKKIIDDKCDAAVKQINTFVIHKNNSGSKWTIKRVMAECKCIVTFISSMIKVISNVLKIITGWIARFIIHYVKKIMKWLS